MNPWDILGWILIIVIVLTAASFTIAFIQVRWNRLKRLWWHYETRNIPPIEGQRWDQEGEILRIGPHYPAGHFIITCGSASWGEMPEDWKERVKNRKLFLIDQLG